LSFFAHLSDFFGRNRQRFLANDMLAGPERGQHGWRVDVIRGADIHGVEVELHEVAKIAENVRDIMLLGQRPRGVEIHVGARDDLRLRDGFPAGNMTTPRNATGTNYAHFELAHVL
jgi:hypothetical protein